MEAVFKIVIPMAMPGLATIGLFLTLGYWNDWFNAMMYIDSQNLIPLQYLLIKIESSIDWLASNKAMMGINGIQIAQNMPKETIKMAIVVISTANHLCLPLLPEVFCKWSDDRCGERVRNDESETFEEENRMKYRIVKLPWQFPWQ